MRRRALEWLAEADIVDPGSAEAALADLAADEMEVGAAGVPVQATAALRALYGERLRSVVLFGSYARGDADVG